MFKLVSFQDNCLEVHYDYPCSSPLKVVKVVHDKKIDAMYSFASITLSVLDVRMDEFFDIIQFNLLKIYESQIRNKATWMFHYNRWVEIHERANNMRNHRHAYASFILEHIQKYEEIIPNEKILESWKMKLQGIVTDLRKTAKQSKKVIEKIQDSL